MKQVLKVWMIMIGTLSFLACNAQIKNAKTESVKIYGNCSMCESTIEKAGNRKKVAKVDWNEDTQMATITYDAKKTNTNEILKRIALSGYDSDKFLAPNDAYAKLPDCCQYERKAQTVAKVDVNKVEVPKMRTHEDHSSHNHTSTAVDNKTAPLEELKGNVPQLEPVFYNYFALKDALVKTDGNTAATKAKNLVQSLKNVKMEQLTANEHTVWMKSIKDLTLDADHIAETKDISHQRDHFMSLSKNMYELIKSSKLNSPVYYQFCPMANDGKGANWLSKEKVVMNPYYGSQMMNCGKVVETIK